MLLLKNDPVYYLGSFFVIDVTSLNFIDIKDWGGVLKTKKDYENKY